jgi:hypothetical protein
MPHFTLQYDIGGHAAKQAENGLQNFAEYFLFSLNRFFWETGVFNRF